jgi:hypothetical protein
MVSLPDFFARCFLNHYLLQIVNKSRKIHALHDGVMEYLATIVPKRI